MVSQTIAATPPLLSAKTAYRNPKTGLTRGVSQKKLASEAYRAIVRRVSETPTPTRLQESTAVHLQFVWQYPPHLYRRTFPASKLRRKGNPAIRLPFVLQYASHLYGSTPPTCTAALLENTGGWGHRKVPDIGGVARNSIANRAIVRH